MLLQHSVGFGIVDDGFRFRIPFEWSTELVGDIADVFRCDGAMRGLGRCDTRLT